MPQRPTIPATPRPRPTAVFLRQRGLPQQGERRTHGVPLPFGGRGGFCRAPLLRFAQKEQDRHGQHGRPRIRRRTGCATPSAPGRGGRTARPPRRRADLETDQGAHHVAVAERAWRDPRAMARKPPGTLSPRAWWRPRTCPPRRGPPGPVEDEIHPALCQPGQRLFTTGDRNPALKELLGSDARPGRLSQYLNYGGRRLMIGWEPAASSSACS